MKKEPSWIHYPHLALLTDFYQFTMAYGYFKAGLASKNACFQLFFRKPPFSGSYAIACGLENIIRYVENFHFTPSDLDYLSKVSDFNGQPMFDKAFLHYLRDLRFTCDIDAVPEGTVVFGHEPLLRVRGPILLCQLLETPLLNIINFQTLIATKATRVCHAAQGNEVIDFGLRRAQGFDGGISASRAAYVGGCSSTSNVFAGMQYGIPVKGTLAHSWVMSFSNEQKAFATYAEVMPTNCVLLVDTYHTVEGVKHAIATGKELARKNHRLLGIRLDSGNLAHLSKTARQMLNEAGFQDTQIVASGDLDEYRIEALKQQDAPIDAWGVGTRLITAFDDPALGGIYKLAAVEEEGKWRPCMKVSDDDAKSTIPGILQTRRYKAKNQFLGDVLYDITETSGPSPNRVLLQQSNAKPIAKHVAFEDLLVPIFNEGRCVYDLPTLEQIRDRVTSQLGNLHPSIKTLKSPEQYGVWVDQVLALKRQQLRITGH